MSFAVPEGFVDMNEHVEFERTGLARQLRRLGAANAIGPEGKLLYTAVGVMPVGPAEGMNMSESRCSEMADQFRGRFQSQVRQMGLKSTASVKEVHFPGEIPDTDCEFSVELGRGEHFAMVIFFEHQETSFLATCEAENFEEAVKLCDDLFYSWSY